MVMTKFDDGDHTEFIDMVITSWRRSEIIGEREARRMLDVAWVPSLENICIFHYYYVDHMI